MDKLSDNLELNRCPHCRVDSPNLSRVVNFFNTSNHHHSFQRTWGIYACKKCGGVVIAGAKSHDMFIRETYPNIITVDDIIPTKAKAFLNQAIDSIHAPSGAIMLAASSVDAMLKDKGYKDGVLYKRIEKAENDHLITPEMAKWAHEIRLDANDERHADEDADLPNSDDAKKTIDFALALAEYLFVLPSKIERGIKEATEVK